jgi:hypothetical protein
MSTLQGMFTLAFVTGVITLITGDLLWFLVSLALAIGLLILPLV